MLGLGLRNAITSNVSSHQICRDSFLAQLHEIDCIKCCIGKWSRMELIRKSSLCWPSKAGDFLCASFAGLAERSLPCFSVVPTGDEDGGSWEEKPPVCPGPRRTRPQQSTRPLDATEAKDIVTCTGKASYKSCRKLCFSFLSYPAHSTGASEVGAVAGTGSSGKPTTKPIPVAQHRGLA